MLNTLEVEAMNYGYRVRIVNNKDVELSAMWFRSDGPGCFRLQQKKFGINEELTAHGMYAIRDGVYFTKFISGEGLFSEYDKDTQEFCAFELLRRSV